MDFDVAMPSALFLITLASIFLNEKVEDKLKSTLQERELAVRDIVLLVAAMATMISLIVFIPTSAIMILFLFSYSMLMFMFTYILAGKRWYVAVAPSALFILLYLFLNDTRIWSVYLLNVYAVIFAVLITLYLASLFTWKTTLVFAFVLTALDIVLVLVTGTMVSAANKAQALSLPVLVTLPVLPVLIRNDHIIYMSLGLGDFFFAGLLALQSLKLAGKRFAVFSAVGMSISFLVFEFLLLSYLTIPFPGTVMIITGWLPIIAWKKLKP
jgi:hypothetical protein